MKVYKNIHWIIVCLLLALSCARQTTPTGGPKDTIPPFLISSFPRHGEINFKGKTIELTFSETVILNNPRDQIIITPDVGKENDITSKKDKVTIALKNNLLDSTTYSINFRESVQDITEKNPAQMLKLAFSTGNYVDSLVIDGTTYDLLTGKEIKDATIALYQSDTFDIFRHRPTYFTKSDNKAKFSLDNLKPGTYYIYAIEDKNKNLIADSKTESYGYRTEPIVLAQNVYQMNVSLVRLDSRPLKLINARPYGTYFNIKTSKNLQNFKVTTDEHERIISSFGEDQTNIRVYNTFDQDSLAVNLTAIDSINNSIDTTLYIKFLKREVKPEKFDYTLADFKVIETKGTIQGKINFSKPVIAYNFDSISYRIDSMKSISITQQDIHWDSLNNKLTIEKSFDKSLLIKESSENKNVPRKNNQNEKSNVIQNQLYLGTGAFISIERDSSARKTEKIIPTKLEDSGVLIVEIETTQEYFIVQLLTRDFKIITSRRNTKKFNFEDLKPGDYQLRLIIDKNNDGKWNPGNSYENEEPEQITFYKNEKGISLINLKANWELGPLLITH